MQDDLKTSLFQEPVFQEDSLYHSSWKAVEEVHKDVADADSDLSLPINIPGNRISCDQTTLVDAGSEPNWVRDINEDGTSDASSYKEHNQTKSCNSCE